MTRMLIATGCLLAAASCFSQAQKSHRIVIELNVPGTIAYQTVLGNSEHLMKAFAPERVQIEIVCEGSGLDMLFTADNKLAGRIKKAHDVGIEFAACGNTVAARHISRSHLFSFVQVVDAGVAEVVRKQEAGWTYLKGAF